MKRILALLLVLAMSMALLAGCGGDAPKEEKKEKKDKAAQEEVVEKAGTAEESEEGEEAEEETTSADSVITDNIVLEKIGTISTSVDYYTPYSGGIQYKVDGKYGIASSDGMHETGAIYVHCNPVGNYFEVSTTEIVNYGDVNQVNSKGLIDGDGKVIIPAKYAQIKVLNNGKYAAAITAGAFATDKVLVTIDSNKYSGTWCVYNLTNGSIIPNVTGTDNGVVQSKGDLIFAYTTGNETYGAHYNAAGTELTGHKRVFDNGTYAVEGKIGEVFDADGTKLFGYDLTGFIPKYVYGEYYVADKYDDGYSYAVMDKTGMVISTEFDESITVVGEIIYCDNKVYSFDGTEIGESEYTPDVDSVFGKYYYLNSADGEHKVIDKDGNVYFADNAEFNDSSFIAKSNDLIYNFKDKDYTIEGNATYDAPWLAKENAPNGRYHLVNTITGERLLDGYKDYRIVKVNGFASYIYATYDGGTELYLYVAEDRISEIQKKKVDLLAELTDAFAKEGITVNINKETGEMAMDSTVLFGGDSAVLTDAGKEFLKKFMKVYTQIAYSPKYKGFITKTLVEGHAAPVPGSSYAQSLPLSEQRAQNVMNFCMSPEIGVDVTSVQGTFEAIGHGNSRPILLDNGEVNMEASRRVAFTFLIAVDFLK